MRHFDALNDKDPDEIIEEDSERHVESGQEEPELLPFRLIISHVAKPSDQMERKRADSPIAASTLVLGRPFRVLMMRSKGAFRVLMPEIPIDAGSSPTAMLIAAPVMEGVVDTRRMNSTIHPALVRQMRSRKVPKMRSNPRAISSGPNSGSSSRIPTMTLSREFDVTTAA